MKRRWPDGGTAKRLDSSAHVLALHALGIYLDKEVTTYLPTRPAALPPRRSLRPRLRVVCHRDRPIYRKGTYRDLGVNVGVFLAGSMGVSIDKRIHRKRGEWGSKAIRTCLDA